MLIACSLEDSVPGFMEGRGRGWVTAEYAMHPRANPERQRRARNGKIDGRSQEIQLLIGRSLRAAVVPEKMGERTMNIDCDVLDADGGTRTASITGGWVAMAIALDRLRKDGKVHAGVLRPPVAAVSASSQRVVAASSAHERRNTAPEPGPRSEWRVPTIQREKTR